MAYWVERLMLFVEIIFFEQYAFGAGFHRYAIRIASKLVLKNSQPGICRAGVLYTCMLAL
jgi:hypothetical protein